ncbi:MAG: hypothetical protein JXB30_00015 [Anaerolineae bacterium]|nr:hypothetical protein [Anaerolineae bacterium]
MRRSKLARQIAQAFWWIGLMMMVVGISLAILRFRFPGFMLIGGSFVVLGLNALIGGEITAGPEPRSFTARGSVVRGRLEAKTGLCDLVVGKCGSDRVATTHYGPLGKPGFEVRDGIAYLRLVQAAFQPNVTQWRSELAANVLWDVEAHSFIGELIMDLSELRLEEVIAGTKLGYIKMTCPTRGYVRMSLNSTFGEIEIEVPPQVGVKVAVKKGPLATLAINNERIETIRHNRYATPDFDAAPAQVEIHIRSSAGDIILT